MANYTNCITLEQMEWLELFDEMPYKVVKKIVKLHDETDFEVEIEDLPNDEDNMCSTSFTFKLEIDISEGYLPLMVKREYCVIKEYDSSSLMAMYIGENLVYPESEEEEVRCVCPKCFAEGYTFVSKQRAYVLKQLEEMEEMCPFGEKCKGEEEEEEEEEWFNQQSFKGTSWNYVLDEAEKHFKCSLNSEMNNKERIIHDCLYKLWNKLKEEEEEEEEEEEIPTLEGTPGSVLPLNVVNTIRAWLEKNQAPLCFRINGGECKQCNNLCVDEEDSLCHKCYHKSNPVECYCDEEENRAWSKEKKIKI